MTLSKSQYIRGLQCHKYPSGTTKTDQFGRETEKKQQDLAATR